METFRLTSESIMAIVEKTGVFLADKETDRKNALRTRLAMEEVLLSFQEKFGEDASVELHLQKRFGASYAVFRIYGESFDPFGSMTDDNRVLHNLMENMGMAPSWSYRHACNEVLFSAAKKKKLSSLMKVLIAVVLGIGMGLLVRMLPGSIPGDISNKWMAPVQDAVMGLLSCLSALFVLLSVTSGICGMGDVTTFNRVGRRMIFRLMLGLLLVTVVTALILLLIFPLSDSTVGQVDLSALWQLVVGIIPTNIIETFATGNTIQIVFLAIFSSIILLVLGPRAQQLVDIITQLSNLLQNLVQCVITLMPFVVFVSLFRLNADGDLEQLFKSYKYLLVVFLLCAIFLVYRITYIAVKYKLPPLMLIKKFLPTFMIAFSTASSSAALPENLNTCENRLGIDRQIVNIGIPLGQTIYMPSIIFTILTGSLCAAQIFGVPISLPSYIILVFTAYVITIAAPPVPGAFIAAFALVMTQIGLPSDAMAFIIALDPIIDRICTGTYICGLQTELVDIAASLDMLDKEKLHKAE